MNRRLALLALLVLALPLHDALAQRGLRGRAAGIMAAVQDATLLGVILTHKDDLKLTADQVTRLRKLDSTTTATNAPTMEKLRALRGDSSAAVRPMEMTQEQRAIARQKLEEARPLLEDVRKVDTKAADQARALLDDNQKAALQKILDEQAAGRGGRRARRPATSLRA